MPTHADADNEPRRLLRDADALCHDIAQDPQAPNHAIAAKAAATITVDRAFAAMSVRPASPAGRLVGRKIARDPPGFQRAQHRADARAGGQCRSAMTSSPPSQRAAAAIALPTPIARANPDARRDRRSVPRRAAQPRGRPPALRCRDRPLAWPAGIPGQTWPCRSRPGQARRLLVGKPQAGAQRAPRPRAFRRPAPRGAEGHRRSGRGRPRARLRAQAAPAAARPSTEREQAIVEHRRTISGPRGAASSRSISWRTRSADSRQALRARARRRRAPADRAGRRRIPRSKRKKRKMRR